MNSLTVFQQQKSSIQIRGRIVSEHESESRRGDFFCWKTGRLVILTAVSWLTQWAYPEPLILIPEEATVRSKQLVP